MVLVQKIIIVILTPRGATQKKQQLSIIMYYQRSAIGLTGWVMAGILAFELSSSIHPFRQQRCRDECEARGAQQSYSAINRVIFPRNAKHRKQLSSKNTEVKAKAVFSCAGLRTAGGECAEPRNLLFSYVLFARAERGAKRNERVCGIPAESGHPPPRPRERPCRQNIYNAADNRNPRN